MQTRGSAKRKPNDNQQVPGLPDGIRSKARRKGSDLDLAVSNTTRTGEHAAAKFFSPQNEGFPYELIYRPLKQFRGDACGNEHVFRVVRILPGSGDETIECELLRSRLARETAYEALSYCAGDATDCRGILLNGFPFNTFRSTYEALRRFRLSHEQRVFWVDQICINQANIEERDSQILLMKIIYQNAARTHIWLGEALSRPPTHLAFDLLRQFLHSNRTTLREYVERIGTARPASRNTGDILTDTVPQEHIADPLRRYLHAEHEWYNYYNDRDPLIKEERAKEWREDPVLRESGLWVQTAANDPRYADCWLALFDLFQRPWWRRCWIVQEVVVSGELHLVCGSEFLVWEDLSLFLNTCSLLLCLPMRDIDLGDQHMESSISLCTDIHYHINGLRRPSSAATLRTCMIVHHDSMASDARDKVYAMLGMLLDSGQKYGITPSYAPSNTTLNVYLAAAEAILTVDHDPNLLCDVTGHELDVGLPSWVPDWSRTKCSQIGSYQPRFQAGTSHGTSLTVSEDRRKLKICGWIVDSIEALGPMDDGVRFSEALVEWTSIFRRQTQDDHDLHALDRFYRTLGLDSWQGPEVDPNRHAGEFHKVWDVTMQLYGKRRDRLSKNSRFFMSKNGLPGMAPQNAQAGHTIFIPWNVRMPVVIRKVSDSDYQLIGPCYLHDMMFHEVRIKEYQGEVRSEDIYLV